MPIEEYLLQEEEGRVGNVNGLTISVYTEPLLKPSFHIRNKTFDKHYVYQIKDFKLLEKKSEQTFTSKELKMVSNWLKEKSDAYEKLTNWQVLIIFWNLINENSKISVETKQPEF